MGTPIHLDVDQDVIDQRQSDRPESFDRKYPIFLFPYFLSESTLS